MSQTWKKVGDIGEYDLYEAANGETAWVRWEGGRPVVVKSFDCRGRETYREEAPKP